MKLVNRAAVLVTPRQPYIDWATTEAGIEVSEKDFEGTTYLVPEFEDNDQLEQILERASERIFREELAAWDQREETWPSNLSLSRLREWFEVVACAMVFDAVDE